MLLEDKKLSHGFWCWEECSSWSVVVGEVTMRGDMVQLLESLKT